MDVDVIFYRESYTTRSLYEGKFEQPVHRHWQENNLRPKLSTGKECFLL